MTHFLFSIEMQDFWNYPLVSHEKIYKIWHLLPILFPNKMALK